MATLAWVANTAGGTLAGADVGFDSISTDTRSIEPGQLFVALRGKQHDATAFVTEAASRGAVAAIVEHLQDLPLPQVVVPDAGDALRTVATAWRQRFVIPVLGVTGSNGKTTLKEMMAAILRADCAGTVQHDVAGPAGDLADVDDGDVLATWGNLNNHIGVPITLLWLRDRHRAAVIEMGASAPGEIALLTRIARPTVGVITNVGPAHLAGFGGTLEHVAAAKGELFAELPAGATAVINRDDAFHDYWRKLRTDIAYRSFGLAASADFRAVDIRTVNGDRTEFRLLTPDGEVEIQLGMAGRHNVQNALAAAAATTGAGASLAAVRDGLAAMENVKGRLRSEIGPANCTIYDDSYNANPGSVSAAIRFLASQAGQRWFVLGDMAELGPDEIALHREMGALAASSGLDRFYAVGPLARHAAEAFGPTAHWAADVQSLADAIRPELAADVRLLVKGSRSAGLERLVKTLTGEDMASTGSQH
ncbi:MAG: UDP-N-acetylmuramoyl-tripeptide--D-alanyl-D-alanine ligase [Gammaproteobacteria bacterium]